MIRALVAARVAGQVAVPRRLVVSVVAVVSLALLTAVAAQVRIMLPFSPVPVTLQTFAVVITGIAGGPLLGALSQALYVGAGACGVPVFAGLSAGMGGATTGYLMAFPVAAWLAGVGARSTRSWTLPLTLVCATVVVYAFGAGWLWLFLGKSASTALSAGVLPFIPGDAMKAFAVCMLSGTLRAVRTRGAG